MPQSPEQRRYWAQHCLMEKRSGRSPIPRHKRKEVVLVASSLAEYAKMCHDYPNLKVRLDAPKSQQLGLF